VGVGALVIFFFSFLSHVCFCSVPSSASIDPDPFLDRYGLERCEDNRAVFRAVIDDTIKKYPMSKPKKCALAVNESLEKFLNSPDVQLLRKSKQKKRWLQKRLLLCLFFGLGVSVTAYLGHCAYKAHNQALARASDLESACESKDCAIEQLRNELSQVARKEKKASRAAAVLRGVVKGKAALVYMLDEIVTKQKDLFIEMSRLMLKLDCEIKDQREGFNKMADLAKLSLSMGQEFAASIISPVPQSTPAPAVKKPAGSKEQSAYETPKESWWDWLFGVSKVGVESAMHAAPEILRAYNDSKQKSSGVSFKSMSFVNKTQNNIQNNIQKNMYNSYPSSFSGPPKAAPTCSRPSALRQRSSSRTASRSCVARAVRKIR